MFDCRMLTSIIAAFRHSLGIDRGPFGLCLREKPLSAVALWHRARAPAERLPADQCRLGFRQRRTLYATGGWMPAYTGRVANARASHEFAPLEPIDARVPGIAWNARHPGPVRDSVEAGYARSSRDASRVVVVSNPGVRERFESHTCWTTSNRWSISKGLITT